MYPKLFAIEAIQTHLPIVIGCGVAILVLTSLSIFFVRRSGRIVPMTEAVRKEKTVTDHLDESYADRRNSVRREGAPVPVFLSASTFKGVQNGYVMDRSRSGMKIAMEQPVTPTTVLQVKAENAPVDTPWVSMIVRSCKSVSTKHYELGCEFESPPPWSILLLFG